MEPLEVEGGKGIVQLDPTGVVRLSWASAVRIEEADARAAMAAVNEVANGGEYPMLVDMASTSSVSRKARAVFSIPCAASRIALLGASPVDRVLPISFSASTSRRARQGSSLRGLRRWSGSDRFMSR